MRPRDFDVPETDLDSRLQEHQNSPSIFDPHSQFCQAECSGRLYTHVHSVAGRRERGGEVFYLVRWKVCWTPRRNIDDLSWLKDSLDAHRDKRYRRSTRLEKSFEDREKKLEKVMLVVNLE